MEHLRLDYSQITNQEDITFRDVLRDVAPDTATPTVEYFIGFDEEGNMEMRPERLLETIDKDGICR